LGHIFSSIFCGDRLTTKTLQSPAVHATIFRETDFPAKIRIHRSNCGARNHILGNKDFSQKNQIFWNKWITLQQQMKNWCRIQLHFFLLMFENVIKVMQINEKSIKVD
jgi:hypothetical protein